MKKPLFAFSLPLLLLLLSTAALCTGQNLSMSFNQPASGAKVLTGTLAIANNPALSPAAAIQGCVVSSPPLGALSATIVGSALSSNKVITVAGNCFLIGGTGSASGTPPLNANAIADGTIAALSIVIPSGFAGNVSIALTGGALPPLASSSAGSGFNLTPNPPVSVSILPSISFCDINGDGQTNQGDVAAEMALVFAQDPKGVRGSSSAPSIADLETVINAAMGQPCTAIK